MNIETELAQPLWLAIRRSYESQAWSNAVLDAVHFLSESIRAKTGLQSDGTSLAGQAFGGKSPKLRLNRLETESEKNLQAGMEQLHRGLYQAIRNPRSHEKVEDSQHTADALIVFIDYLLSVIGTARTSFSIDESVAKITDENFVPNSRYAQLIVQDIPARQLLNVTLAVYQAKESAKGARLRYFFDVAVPLLSEAESAELFAAISDELASSSDDRSLTSVFQVLDPKYWTRIGEAARLRSENRIVANIRQGLYNESTKKCSSGALATWSRDCWPNFSLKREVLWAINGRLTSGVRDAENYVFEYCFPRMECLAEKPPSWLEEALIAGLSAGDIRFKRSVDAHLAFGPWEEAWSQKLKDAIATFQPQEVVEFDDDIPF